MKLSIRLIVILAVSITLVTFVVARNQVRSEKRGLRADLERRAETLAESLQETIEPVVQRGATTQLRRIVERFGNREHLAGIAVYDVDGKALAISPKLAVGVQDPPSLFEQCKTRDQGVGAYQQIGDSAMYVYALPLHRDSAVAGILILYHDASYIEAQSTRIWRDALWHVIAQVLLNYPHHLLRHSLDHCRSHHKSNRVDARSATWQSRSLSRSNYREFPRATFHRGRQSGTEVGRSARRSQGRSAVARGRRFPVDRRPAARQQPKASAREFLVCRF